MKVSHVDLRKLSGPHVIQYHIDDTHYIEVVVRPNMPELGIRTSDGQLLVKPVVSNSVRIARSEHLS